jgi:DNA repair exonuclease SbcCD ATPase subunit
MKLSSIRIQGMHKVTDKTYNLGNMNYLNGLNGAGKTTVMQAIQLALLGYIPGTDKRSSAIYKHASLPEMRVTLNVTDGGEGIQIMREYCKISKDITTKSVTTPQGYNIENIMQGLDLPVCNFDEFVGMTANKLKDWFMSFLPAADADFVWETVLKSELTNYGKILDPVFVKEIIDYAKDVSIDLEGIRKLNEYLKTVQSFKKSEVTRIQSTIQSLVHYDDCDDTLDIDKLKEVIVTQSENRDTFRSKKQSAENNMRTLQQIESLDLAKDSKLEDDAEYQSKQAELIKLNEIEFDEADTSKQQSEVETLRSELDKINEQVVEKRAQIKEKQTIIDGKGVCPYTQTQCTEIGKMFEQYQSDVKSLESDISKLVTKSSTINTKMTDIRQNIADIENEFKIEQRNHNDKIRELEAEISTIEQLYARFSGLTSQLVPFNELYSDDIKLFQSDVGLKADGIETAELYDKLAIQFQSAIQTSEGIIVSEQDRVMKLEANKKFNELTEEITKQKFQIEQDVDILKDWIKLTDVNGLQSRVMDKPFEHLAGQMTVYLVKLLNNVNVKAKFNLSEKANSFSFGWTVDELEINYIEFDQMSAGERCLYTLALLLSIVGSEDINMPLIMVDDLLDHLDTNNILNVFKTLIEVENIQIILAGVHKCPLDNTKDIVIEVK